MANMKVIFMLVATITFSSCVQAQNCNGFRANPSVYNFEIGGKAAKVIADGRLEFEVEQVYTESPYVVRRAFQLNFQSDSPIVFENNILYLDLGDEGKVLFDTGNSFLWNRTFAGFFFYNLEAEGIDRNSITDIFINHGHFDHIGGLLLPDDKTRAFPNARVHINKDEIDFWLQDRVPLDNVALPQANKDFLISSAKQVFEAIESQLEPFEGEAEFFNGTIQAQPYTWHTPGHTAYLIKIGSDKLLYAGDSFGIESTSINNPWFRLRFDFDRDAGAEGRVKLLDEVAKSKLKVLTYHGSFPGIGYIVRNDLSFDFKPANYEWAKAVRTTCSIN